jgi:hypothetical protein
MPMNILFHNSPAFNVPIFEVFPSFNMKFQWSQVIMSVLNFFHPSWCCNNLPSYRRWLRLLFGREFPLQDLLVLWDAIFAEGENFELVNYIVVAMLIAIRCQCEFCHYITQYENFVLLVYLEKGIGNLIYSILLFFLFSLFLIWLVVTITSSIVHKTTPIFMLWNCSMHKAFTVYWHDSE